MKKTLLTFCFVTFMIISGCQKEDKVSCSEINNEISRQEDIKQIGVSGLQNSLMSAEAAGLIIRKADAEIAELIKGLSDCE